MAAGAQLVRALSAWQRTGGVHRVERDEQELSNESQRPFKIIRPGNWRRGLAASVGSPGPQPGGHGYSFARTSDEQHRKSKAAYYAMIEQVDTEVGRMLTALEETGQAENTIVIYMSDHGEMLGDHGMFLKGPYFYEGAIRVPLIMRWPGKYKADLRSDALVEMTDLAPTLLEAAGLPIPAGVQGRSLNPLLTGKTTPHRDSIYCQFYDSLGIYNPPPMGTCVRNERYKLIHYRGLKSGERYDLDKDPTETHSLWDSSNDRSARRRHDAHSGGADGGHYRSRPGKKMFVVIDPHLQAARRS